MNDDIERQKMNEDSERLRRLVDFYNNKNVGPYTLDLKLTNRCNLNCVFCPTKSMLDDLSKEEISEKDYCRLIQEASELGVKEVYIGGGGEPLMRKRLLLNLMDLIKKKGMRGILITNGTILNENNIKKIINIRWDDIFFSIDSSNEKINDYLRGKEGSFKIAIKNIKEIQKIKANEKRFKPHINISSVLTNKNYKDIPGLIELAYKNKLDSLFLQTLVVWSKEHEKYKLDGNSNFLSYLEKAKLKADKLGVVNNLNEFMDVNLNEKSSNKLDKNKKINLHGGFENFCTMPFLYFCVRVDGVVEPCMSKSIVLGDIKKQSLKEIWFGDDMQKFRKSLIKNQKHDFCKDCCAKIMNQRLFDKFIKKISDKNG
jgi:radical SAM protein with 4Fe4S-binding SPASM domain